MDVPGEMLGVFIGFDDYRLVTPLEQVAASLPLGVVVVGVGAADMLHDLGEVAGRGSQEK